MYKKKDLGKGPRSNQNHITNNLQLPPNVSKRQTQKHQKFFLNFHPRYYNFCLSLHSFSTYCIFLIIEYVVVPLQPNGPTKCRHRTTPTNGSALVNVFKPPSFTDSFNILGQPRETPNSCQNNLQINWVNG